MLRLEKIQRLGQFESCRIFATVSRPIIIPKNRFYYLNYVYQTIPSASYLRADKGPGLGIQIVQGEKKKLASREMIIYDFINVFRSLLT